MKLVFPGGEHPAVLLGPGIHRVGSDPASRVVLDRPGMQRMLCELNVGQRGVTLNVAASAPVTVNGRLASGAIALRSDDVIGFDGVRAHLADAESERAPAGDGSSRRPASDDPMMTVVRPALPQYVLRGISGAGFGRAIPVTGPTTLGRDPSCGIVLDYPGLSRRHALLTPTPEGLLVEDMGSSNGCLLNDVRVTRGHARHGDELGFDVLRLRVVEPGHAQAVGTPRRGLGGPSHAWWLALLTVVGAAIALLLLRQRGI